MTAERLVRAGQLFWGKIGTCLNETFVVEYDATAEAAGVGIRSCHYEHVGDILFLDFSGLSVPPRNPFVMVDPFKADNFCVCQQADVRGLFDSTNELFRQCGSKARTSVEYEHILWFLC